MTRSPSLPRSSSQAVTSRTRRYGAVSDAGCVGDLVRRHTGDLRSYLKTGRFDELFDWSFATAANWWSGQHDPSAARRGPIPTEEAQVHTQLAEAA